MAIILVGNYKARIIILVVIILCFLRVDIIGVLQIRK